MRPAVADDEVLAGIHDEVAAVAFLGDPDLGAARTDVHALGIVEREDLAGFEGDLGGSDVSGAWWLSSDWRAHPDSARPRFDASMLHRSENPGQTRFPKAMQ